MVIHDRAVFNVLDLIGEIGGLFDGLQYIAKFMLGVCGLIWNESVYSHLTTKLFDIDKGIQSSQDQRGLFH